FFQAEDGIRDFHVTGVQTCALPISPPWAVQPNEPEVGLLFLDELGQASHDVQKPAAELLLHRQVGSYKLPPGWIVVAATNRESRSEERRVGKEGRARGVE